MRKIALAESTLSHDLTLSFKEKLEAARLLDALGVDIIETCPVGDEKEDEILVKTIAASAVNSIVSCPVLDNTCERAWNAIKTAAKPRLNVKLPVSVVQIEYLCRKKPAKMLEYITSCVAAAKALCPDVEFTCLDATRAEEDFLIQAVSAACAAGADTISFSDDAGNMLPYEFGDFIGHIYEKLPLLNEKVVGVHTSDHLSMAEACAFEAVKHGASLVYTRARGKDMPALRIFAEILSTKGEALGIYTGVDYTVLNRTSDRIMAFSKIKDVSSHPAPADDTPVPSLTLDRNSTIDSVRSAALSLGYELSNEDLAKVFERFLSIVKKKAVDMRELDAVIASVALQVPPTYTLSSYVVNTGNIITTTSHVVLDKHGTMVQGLSVGDGPIDASLKAIESIIGHHYELDDFRLQSVTSGQEAMGEALVRLRDGGKLYSGRGISTDIIGASIRAYLNALNKIVYKAE